jgi:ferredoxin
VSDRQAIIRELAREALAEGRIDCFVGWGPGYDGSQVIPVFAKDAAEVEELQWNPLCHHNLTMFLKRKMAEPADARIGVCVKGCDSRTLVALLQEGLVDRERLYIVGVPCDGVIDRRKIDREFAAEVVEVGVNGDTVVARTAAGAEKHFDRPALLLDQCAACRFPNPRVADDIAGDTVPEPEGEPVWPALEEFESLSPAEKDGLLAAVFSSCIRCFACIHACPVCYCWDQCVNRSRTPALVGQRVETPENLMFQLVHIFHVAGRCPSCGACDRACPVEIPLYLLHQKMNKELYDMLGFEAGVNVDDRPALQAFNLDDPFGQG